MRRRIARKYLLYIKLLIGIFIALPIGFIMSLCLYLSLLHLAGNFNLTSVIVSIFFASFAILSLLEGTGSLYFLKLIWNKEIVITDYYDPELLLKRECNVERKKILRPKLLSPIDFGDSYYVTCRVYGSPVRMILLTRAEVAGPETESFLGNVHIILEGYDLFDYLELD